MRVRAEAPVRVKAFGRFREKRCAQRVALSASASGEASWHEADLALVREWRRR